ncbi:MAG: hypothetical protein HQL99_10235 [Magnetococcales bacterium]|nr:hypothetical protein [Magnetococcales bacterium]
MIPSTRLRVRRVSFGRFWFGVMGILLCGVWFLCSSGRAEAALSKSYRQPAYISNAYFSDKMVQKGETMQPMSVVKALRAGSDGVAGYFVLDLVLTSSGTHHFKVDILDQEGNLATRLDYPPVQAVREDHLPMYTAVGTIGGKLAPGLWFFKVFDQLDKKGWETLGTLGILVVAPSGE